MSELFNLYERHQTEAVTTFRASNTRKDGTYTKMSDLMDSLPAGIVDKAVTGLGGTTLELDCNRNSIVVEPLNITAFNKSQKRSRTHQYRLFYFGTASYAQHGDQFIKLWIKSNTSSSLSEYISYCEKHKQPKKILCVSDQLLKLKDCLKELNDSMEDYHLILDEIDSMQEQIDFRNVMQECIDIYKAHPKEKRTVLSATINTFHDPELKGEHLTQIEILDLKKIPAVIHASPNHPYRIKELILEILQKHPNDKCLVALNSISSIKSTLDLLKQSGQELSIGVLCSEASKDEFPEHYVATMSDELPRTVNFITAAFFSGFDISEPAHVIISVDARTYTQRLSHKTIYQIQGRVRPGVLSCHLVCHFLKPERNAISSEELQDAVIHLTQTKDLVNSYKRSKNPILKSYSNVIQNVFVNGHSELRSIWTYKGDQIEISYLKMDSLLVDEQTRMEVSSVKRFKKSIGKYFDIQDFKEYEDESETRPTEAIDDLYSLIRQIGSLNLQNPQDQGVIKEKRKEFKGRYSKKILEILIRSFDKKVFLPDALIPSIVNILGSEDWKAKLDALALHVEFHALITGTEIAHKHFIYSTCSNLKKMASEQFNEHLKVNLDMLKAACKVYSSDHFKLSKKLTNPTKFQKALLQVDSSRNNKVSFKEVTSLNPFDVLNLDEYPTLDIQAIEAGRALIVEETPFIIRSEKDLPESYRRYLLKTYEDALKGASEEFKETFINTLVKAEFSEPKKAE